MFINMSWCAIDSFKNAFSDEPMEVFGTLEVEENEVEDFQLNFPPKGPMTIAMPRSNTSSAHTGPATRTGEIGRDDSMPLTLSQSLPFVRSSKSVKRNPESERESVHDLQSTSTSRSHQPITSRPSAWRGAQSLGQESEESLVDSLLGEPRSFEASAEQSGMHLCSRVVSRTSKSQNPLGYCKTKSKVGKEYLPNPRQLRQRSGRKKRVVQESKQIAVIQDHLLDLRRKVNQHRLSINSTGTDLRRVKEEPSSMPPSSREGTQVVPGSISPSEWSVFNTSSDHLYTPHHSMQPGGNRHSASSADQPVLWDHEIPAWVPPTQRPIQQTQWPPTFDEGFHFSKENPTSEVPSMSQPMYTYNQRPEYTPEPPAWTQTMFHSQQSHLSSLPPQGMPPGYQDMHQAPRPWSMRHSSNVYPEE